MKPNGSEYAKMLASRAPLHNMPLIPKEQLTLQENETFFNQLTKLLSTSQKIKQQTTELTALYNELKQKITECQKSVDEIKRNTNNNNFHNSDEVVKTKRFRRTNQMIQKLFRCRYHKCDKSYASEGSLQQHIKLKHSQDPPGENKAIVKVNADESVSQNESQSQEREISKQQKQGKINLQNKLKQKSESKIKIKREQRDEINDL